MSIHTPRMFKHVHTFQNVEQENALNTHIDTLAEWWENAEEGIARDGDLIISYHDGETIINRCKGDLSIVYDNLRILSRAPKPKPAWHDAAAVTATATDELGDEITAVWVREGDELWRSDEGGMVLRDDLRDVTPLIEAKVTDEMVNRARVHATAYPINGDDLMRAFLAAALGLDPA